MPLDWKSTSIVGSGVSQGNIYYYDLGGMLVGEFDGTNTNMFLTDTLGSVLERISAAPNSAAVQGNQVYGPYGFSRYYDPVVGRFLSADVLDGNGGGMDYTGIDFSHVDVRRAYLDGVNLSGVNLSKEPSLVGPTCTRWTSRK